MQCNSMCRNLKLKKTNWYRRPCSRSISNLYTNDKPCVVISDIWTMYELRLRRTSPCLHNLICLSVCGCETNSRRSQCHTSFVFSRSSNMQRKNEFVRSFFKSMEPIDCTHGKTIRPDSTCNDCCRKNTLNRFLLTSFSRSIIEKAQEED